MYRVKLKHKFKHKKLLLAVLYFAILLAETSEFFVTINQNKPDQHHESIEERHIEIPTHLPEDSKADLVKLSRRRHGL